MSCNYCDFVRLKRNADEAGHELTKRPENGGVTVLVCPPGEDVDELDDIGEKRWFRAWFMALPNHCCC